MCNSHGWGKCWDASTYLWAKGQRVRALVLDLALNAICTRTRTCAHYVWFSYRLRIHGAGALPESRTPCAVCAYDREHALHAHTTVWTWHAWLDSPAKNRKFEVSKSRQRTMGRLSLEIRSKVIVMRRNGYWVSEIKKRLSRKSINIEGLFVHTS